jgi:hypothetical protein
MTGTPCEVYVPPDLEDDADDAEPAEKQEQGLSDPQSREPIIQRAPEDVDSDGTVGETAGRSPGVRA